MKKYVLLLKGVCLLAFLGSCSAPKMILAEDMKTDMSYAVTMQNEMKIQREDKLNITVYSVNPELAIPFNRMAFKVNSEGAVAAANVTGEQQRDGYVVDATGNIDFPVLGKIHAEGLTRQQLSDSIKGLLIKSNLVSEPQVTTELLNLRIPVLGEVQRVGVLTATEGRMTVVEAISRSGGLTSNAIPEKISVIRTEGAERKLFTVNLRSKELFDSPAYYLQQNDIVFVHPRSTRGTLEETRSWRRYYMLTGLISLVTTLMWYLKN